jgi:hypothetical protein
MNLWQVLKTWLCGSQPDQSRQPRAIQPTNEVNELLRLAEEGNRP